MIIDILMPFEFDVDQFPIIIGLYQGIILFEDIRSSGIKGNVPKSE